MKEGEEVEEGEREGGRDVSMLISPISLITRGSWTLDKLPDPNKVITSLTVGGRVRRSQARRRVEEGTYALIPCGFTGEKSTASRVLIRALLIAAAPPNISSY